MHVFGRWEQAGVPGGNPREHGENTQTPHRKASAQAATVLAGAPPPHFLYIRRRKQITNSSQQRPESNCTHKPQIKHYKFLALFSCAVKAKSFQMNLLGRDVCSLLLDMLLPAGFQGSSGKTECEMISGILSSQLPSSGATGARFWPAF